MKLELEGKVVVITGGTSGFGFEAARLLLEEGACVAITGRDTKRLADAEEKLGANPRLLALCADATRADDWKTVMQTVEGAFGGLDVLVNNAGGGIKIAPLDQLDEATIRAVLELNLHSAILGSREAVLRMKPRGKGQIINVASVCATHAWPGWSVYSAAKAGLAEFTRCLCLEMAKWGGRASLFLPAAARTGFAAAAGLDDSWMAGYPGPTEFAQSLVYLIGVPSSCVIEDLTIWGVAQIRDMSPL